MSTFPSATIIVQMLEDKLGDDVDDSLETDDDPIGEHHFGKGHIEPDDTGRHQPEHKQYTRSRASQRRANLNAMDELDIIETASEDALNLEQICVPVDGDNALWMNRL